MLLEYVSPSEIFTHMLELPALGAFSTILLLAAIAGIISWGLTQAVKSLILWRNVDLGAARWFNPTLRIIAIITGAGLGFLLMHTIVGAGLGAAAGVLNTTIVAIVKSKFRKVAETSDISIDTKPPIGD